LAEGANLLVLGGANDQCEALRELQTLGYRTVCVDQNLEAPGAKIAEKFARVSTRDLNALVEFCETEGQRGAKIDGIITLGTDIPHISSRLAERLNLPGISPQTADFFVDKLLAKERWSIFGVPTPTSTRIHSLTDLRATLAAHPDQDYVLKPADSSGSRGVFRLNKGSFDQLEKIFSLASSATMSKRLLLDEFIPGRQLSTESLVREGKVTTYGFADRNYEWMDRFFPRIIENGGTMPSALNTVERSQVNELLEGACEAIGFSSGIIKGDVVLPSSGKPMIIELAARQSGGQFSTRLIPLSSGISAVGLGAKVALGEAIRDSDLEPSRSYWVANRYFVARPGKVRKINGYEDLEAMPGISEVRMFVEPGSTVRNVESHADRLGFFIAVAESSARLDQTVAEAYGAFSIEIE